MPADEQALAQAFDQLFPMLVQNLLQHFKSETYKAGLTLPQFYLLRQLRMYGPWTAAQVGEALGITSGPVSGLTKRMISQGLLARRVDDTDRRVAWFSVTAKGDGLVAEASRHLVRRWRRVIEEFGAQRAEELLGQLTAIAQILRELQPGDAGRPGA